MEETRENTFNFVTGILFICAVIGWALYYLYTCSPWMAGAFCLIMVGVFVFAIVWKTQISKNSEALEQDICKQLDKQGFRHEKQDGTLYVLKNDNRFRIQLSDGPNKTIKHLFVIYDFGDKNFEKVTMDGWTRATNSININNTSTTFVTLEDHFCCCYQTAINNARDFMGEFDRAYQAIGGVMDDYKKIYPYIERDYPNNTSESKTSIGFK